MDKNDLALQDSFRDTLRWSSVAQNSNQRGEICMLVDRCRGTGRSTIVEIHQGAHNQVYRMRWDDGIGDWAIRFPVPGKSHFTDEKVINEVRLLKLLKTRTSIPVPHVYEYCLEEANPTTLGAYIIMNWMGGRKLADVLDDKGLSDYRPLDSHGKAMLKRIYVQVAKLYLDLWALDFDAIGSPRLKQNTQEIEVVSRPLTLYMNQLLRLYGIDRRGLPKQSRTYASSTDFIFKMIELLHLQMIAQPNSIRDAPDAREKYTVRTMMDTIARGFIRLSGDNYGPFKLFGDDLTPSNILVDPENLTITGVIDWQFTYSAPSSFAGSPPWWLIPNPTDVLEVVGADGFLYAYVRRANLFIEAVEQSEHERGTNLREHRRLSVKMRKSLENMSCWFNSACRMGAKADIVYWKLLDPFCWGSFANTHQERMRRFLKVPLRRHMIDEREEFIVEKLDELHDYHRAIRSTANIRYEPHSDGSTDTDDEDGESVPPTSNTNLWGKAFHKASPSYKCTARPQVILAHSRET
ncbi:hypothetical protein FQN50_000847 [Emmonsiellopsis sp. PD_5]|nr:hypothetical protein FQN50_000847 [Emmonsiellopsis sp. PD_5]